MGIPPSVVSFDADFPPPNPDFVRIVSPRVGVPLRLVIVGQIAVPVLTHWLPDYNSPKKGQTVPHQVPDDTCPLCINLNQRPRYHAYLGCWWSHTGRYYLADLTVSAILSEPRLNPDSDMNLRGLTLVLRRNGTSSQSPVAAELLGPRKATEDIPPDIDAVEVLKRLWGISDGQKWRIG
jgi:hypothetical protein